MKKTLFCVLFIGLTFFAYGQFEYFEWGNGSVIITGYNGSAKSIVIPEKINGLLVTSIGYGAFQSNQLTSVTIPNSVTSIESSAFGNNSVKGSKEPFSIMVHKNTVTITGYNRYETTVVIPEKINGLPVTAIGDGAFESNQLTSVTIPNSVTSIGNEAFSWNQLTSVTIPNSVTAIGWSAFSYNQLTSVTIPNSVTSIGNGAFCHNCLTSVTISNSVTYIGESAFGDNSVKGSKEPFSIMVYKNTVTITGYNRDETTVVIPEKINGLPVTSIEDMAFYDNELTSVTIPNSITSIGIYAFATNKLTSVTIPNSVIDLSESAFDKDVQIIRK